MKIVLFSVAVLSFRWVATMAGVSVMCPTVYHLPKKRRKSLYSQCGELHRHLHAP